MKLLRMLKHYHVSVSSHAHIKIVVGLELACSIIFNAQPQKFTKLPAYFEERTWAFISV